MSAGWCPSSLACAQRVLDDPTLREVLHAARKAADAGGDAHRGRLARRARLSGLVPRLRVAVRRGQQVDLDQSSGVAVGSSRSSQDDEMTLEASALFELDRLVFAADQVRLEGMQRAARAEVQARVREVIGLIFRLERLWIEQSTAAAWDAELALEMAELEVILDSLTDGAFAPLWRRQLKLARARAAQSSARQRAERGAVEPVEPPTAPP